MNHRPVDTTPPLSCDNQNMSPDIARCPAGGKVAPVENHCHKCTGDSMSMHHTALAMGDFGGGSLMHKEIGLLPIDLRRPS